MSSVFDDLLASIEGELLSSVVPGGGSGPAPENEALYFEDLMSRVPHGDVARLVSSYQELRSEMGRDFLALGLLAGGYPPEVGPFLTGRDHRAAVAAALMTYPEQLGPWWRTARLLGFRQLAVMPPREVLKAVFASRQFRPRARRFVDGCVDRYVGALAADRDAWETQVLVDRRSLDELVRYCGAGVPREKVLVLRGGRYWENEAWPRLSAARRLSLAAKRGDVKEVASLLREHRFPLLFVEGVVDVYRPDVAPAAVDLMTPKQLFQRLNRLHSAGLLGDPVVAEGVFRVLERAKRDPRVAPADARRARDLLPGLPPKVSSALEEVERERREALGTGPGGAASWWDKKVCLIVDRSGSMEPAIAAASSLAAYLADQGADVTAVTFAAKASKLEPEAGPDGGPDWQKTFAGVRADGWTSVGAGLLKAHQVAADADLWVVLTDGEDNTEPLADRNSPRPRGNVAVMWFGSRPAPGFRAWMNAVGAAEFHPQVRGGRLDYAALDDLARLCMGSEAIREWLSTVPSHVVAALLEGKPTARQVVDELLGRARCSEKGARLC